MEAPNEPGVEMSPKALPKRLHASAPASPRASNLMHAIADQIGRPEVSEDWNSSANNMATEMTTTTEYDMSSTPKTVPATGSQQAMSPAPTQTDTAASFIDPSLPTISHIPPTFAKKPAIPRIQPNKRSARFLDEGGAHPQPDSDRPSPKRRCLKANAAHHVQQDGDGASKSSSEALPPPALGYFAFSGSLQSLNPNAAGFVSYQAEHFPYQDATTSGYELQSPYQYYHNAAAVAPYYVWEPIGGGGNMGAEPDPALHDGESPLDTNELTQNNNEKADPSNANLYQQLNAFNAGIVHGSGSPFRGDQDPRLVATKIVQEASTISHPATSNSSNPKVKTKQPAADSSTKPALKSKRRIKTSEVPANARPPMGVDITLKEICVFAPKWIIHPAAATRLQRNGVKIAIVAAAQVDGLGRAGEPALLKTVKNRLKKEYNQGGKLYTGSTHWSIDQAVALGADNDLTADQWKFRDFYKHRNKETTKAPTEEWEDIPLTTFYENIPEGKWPTGQDRGILTRMLEQVKEDGLTDLTTAHWNLVAAMLENEPLLQSKIAGKNLDEEAVQAFRTKK